MKADLIRVLLGAAGIASLGLCLGSSIAFFQGTIDADSFKNLFLIASMVWFVVAGTYARQKSRPA